MSSLGMLLLLAAGGVDVPSAMDPQEIVRKADRVRNVAQAYAMDVEIVSERPGKQPARAKYLVYTKDKVKSLVKFTAPASEKGKALLMLNQDMWIYIPTANRPIRLSPLQRLMGDVSNGDIARTNYSDDYDAELAGSEVADEQDCHVLELKARDPRVSYHRIRYWVEKETGRPVKAEFYTLSNVLLKTGHFRSYAPVQGMLRPTELLIIDGQRRGHSSLVRYSNTRISGLSDGLFRLESLPDLR